MDIKHVKGRVWEQIENGFEYLTIWTRTVLGKVLKDGVVWRAYVRIKGVVTLIRKTFKSKKAAAKYIISVIG